MRPSTPLVAALALGLITACASSLPAVPTGPAPAEAQRSASGLAWIVLKPGAGGEPAGPTDRVTVHYTGWTADGAKFDSSLDRGQPATFPVNAVIPGWQEVLQLMRAGEQRRVWIPSELAYGDAPRPGAPAGPLTFDIHVLEIQRATRPPPTPPDVSAVPADATVLPSGLAYKRLAPGTGDGHPTASSEVTVHYTGWTTDGRMFDSSLSRGEPFTARLEHLIAGWQEGLPLMVVGEKARLWIPGELAYGNDATGGRPHGMLVFDVELIAFRP